MNAQQMKKFVEDNPHLVQVKNTSIPELKVLKYKPKVFFKNLWTPELEECRGTVVDEDFNIVSRPFTKIYNYGENGTRINRDEPCVAARKINGFMAAATLYKGELLVSTTGTIDSDYAKLARKWVEPFSEGFLSGFTYMFEIVDKSDPHIIPEEEGAWLIGCRANRWDSKLTNEATLDLSARILGCKRPEWKHVDRFSDIVQESKLVQHEGFVVYGLTSRTALKIKSPYYKTKKLFARMKDWKLLELLDNPKALKRKVEEEYYDLIEYLSERKEQFAQMHEQERLKFIREYFDNE